MTWAMISKGMMRESTFVGVVFGVGSNLSIDIFSLQVSEEIVDRLDGVVTPGTSLEKDSELVGVGGEHSGHKANRNKSSHDYLINAKNGLHFHRLNNSAFTALNSLTSLQIPSYSLRKSRFPYHP